MTNSLENVSAEACLKLGTYIRRVLTIEEVKMSWHKIGDMDIAQAFGVDLSNLNSRSTKRLKKINLYSGVTTGWYKEFLFENKQYARFSANSVSKHQDILTFKNTTVLKQLEHFILRFGG